VGHAAGQWRGVSSAIRGPPRELACALKAAVKCLGLVALAAASSSVHLCTPAEFVPTKPSCCADLRTTKSGAEGSTRADDRSRTREIRAQTASAIVELRALMPPVEDKTEIDSYFLTREEASAAQGELKTLPSVTTSRCALHSSGKAKTAGDKSKALAQCGKGGDIPLSS
jgi:hypothetical protein